MPIPTPTMRARLEAMAVRNFYDFTSMAGSIRDDIGDAEADYYLAVQRAIEIDYAILDARAREQGI